MSYLLGIDIGTSGTKTVLFTEKGEAAASALFEYPLSQPRNGWAEQDPADWWHAVCETCTRVLAGIDPKSIKGVGISGQMHGLVMLDKNDRVLRPSIIWCDQRTGAECAQITEIIGAKRLIEITANPALTGFTASKILWVRNHQPEIYEKTARMMLPKDYIRYMLTGEFATEVSDASGMQLLDVPNRCWSDEVLTKLKIDKALLPKVYESQEVSGRVSASASALTGLAAGTPVVGGAGDQAAGAVGNGIVREGVVSCTLGSSGVVFASTDRVKIDPNGRVHTFCHALPNTWHVMGVTQAAGLSLKWFRDHFCTEEMAVADRMKTDPYILMDKMAESIPIGSDGLVWLPYLMGERTPHLDPNARGVFFGLSAMHTKSHLLRAVMEGVAFSQTDCVEIIRAMGVPVLEVRASGGGGKSPLWRQMLADCFNSEICTVASAEGPALGVAILAGVGAGVYSDVKQGCDIAVQKKACQKPDPASGKVYAGYYEVYKKLYPALKESFGGLSALLK